jgi:enterobactin synthetase component D
LQNRRSLAPSEEPCARRALAAFGCGPVPLARSALGAPRWPPGFDGSITHGARFAAAIAYRVSAGGPRHAIDIVEVLDAAAFADIAPVVLAAGELAARQNAVDVLADVFSAKEAAVKIASPHLGRYVEFGELITIGGRDAVQAVRAPLVPPIIGIRSRRVDGFLLTCAEWRRDRR